MVNLIVITFRRTFITTTPSMLDQVPAGAGTSILGNMSESLSKNIFQFRRFGHKYFSKRIKNGIGTKLLLKTCNHLDIKFRQSRQNYGIPRENVCWILLTQAE